MRFVRQRVVAARPDGHDATGNPGDCLRAVVASLLDLPYDDVPHFGAMRRGAAWWHAMRAYARARGGDFLDVEPVDGSVRHALVDPAAGAIGIGSGPSPRGPFRHVVLVDADLELVHDPHPSDRGLADVEDVFLYTAPYAPAPALLALPAGTTKAGDP